MIKYRVILKVSYYEVWFEFENAVEAMNFATVALQSMVANDDINRKKTKITIQIINPDAEEEEEEED